VSEAELYAPAAAPPPPWRWRIVAGGALLIALALFALVLAHWGWRWFGPAPASVAPRTVDGDYARHIAEGHLFGTAARKVAASEPVTTAGGELHLLGVFAQRDGQGYALFRAGARGPLFIAVGSEVVPGVRLDSVQPGGVTLIDGGARRDITLRGVASADKPRPPVASAGAGAKSATCSVPAGFAGQVIRLNAELLSGMIGAPDSWKALVQSGPGGLVVRDQSGFASMMGLRNGDHVERANGIALAIPDDIAATVLKPLTRSQPVWVSGMRDDKPQQWLYLNAGACPA
jgi:hypothetical protein